MFTELPEGKLLADEPLAKYTSWRVGGPAEILYAPADLADLQNFLGVHPLEWPITFLGLGSNTLVRDGGVPGTVIVLRNSLQTLKQTGPNQIYAEAGVSSGKIARFCARNNLCGLEFLAGVPGTLGGALAMNAGAFNGETWDWVTEVVTVNRQGRFFDRLPRDFSVSYREVKPRYLDEYFVAATFTLKPGDGAASLAHIRECLDHRNATQPTNLPSCGSVFRNPPNDYAARLIESCGLKGFRIGGAEVSTKHANFIVNTGDATAKDIEDLIIFIAKRVKEQHGVSLQKEARIIGQPSLSME